MSIIGRIHPGLRQGARAGGKEIIMRVRLLTQAILLWSAVIALISTSVAAQSSTPSLSDILPQLQAGDWRVRAAALDHLRQVTGWDRTPDAETAIIQLAATENDVLYQAFKEGTGVHRKLGEAYVTYYSTVLQPSLLTLLDNDPNNDDLLAVVAAGSYNPESKLAQRLAATGSRIVPIMKKLAQDEVAPKRANAAGVLGLLLQADKEKPTLTPADRQAALGLIRGAVKDSEPGVRLDAIRALGTAGDQESAALLAWVAANDPDQGSADVPAQYSVRGVARRTLDQLNHQRSTPQKP